MYSIKMMQTELFNDLNEPPDLSGLSDLFELSIDAFYAALYADMSELPIKAEISRFIEKVKKAGGGFPNAKTANTADARIAADRAASDRGDPDVFKVLKAAYKVQHEIHRITGFLRFNPDSAGVYIARCSPDHFVLPALAEHFTLRFGETPWAIIDEKRNLCLSREKGEQARLVPVSKDPAASLESDDWEDLWRLYHRSVNNEARKNPRLQRQFMPERYQKYLPETRQ